MTGTRDARRRLLEAGSALLAEGGVDAATPAAVATRAGAGKMSIYRHFDGKRELIAAALAEREPVHRGWLLSGEAGGSRAAVRELFDKVARAADRGDRFAGCPFIAAAVELRDAEHPAVAVAREHKRRLAIQLEELLTADGVELPAEKALTVLWLLDGAAAHAVIAGEGTPLRKAREVAARLLGG